MKLIHWQNRSGQLLGVIAVMLLLATAFFVKMRQTPRHADLDPGESSTLGSAIGDNHRSGRQREKPRSLPPGLGNAYTELNAAFLEDPLAAAKFLSDPTLSREEVAALARELIREHWRSAPELFTTFRRMSPRSTSLGQVGDLFEKLRSEDPKLGYEVAATISPGFYRSTAFDELSSQLGIEDSIELHARVRQSGFPEDLQVVERNMMQHIGNMNLQELEQFAELDFSTLSKNGIAARIGELLARDLGRDGALERTTALGPSSQPSAVFGALSEGMKQDGGREWLLEKLDSLDPAISIDKIGLIYSKAHR